jgi:hypothetical protein
MADGVMLLQRSNKQKGKLRMRIHKTEDVNADELIDLYSAENQVFQPSPKTLEELALGEFAGLDPRPESSIYLEVLLASTTTQRGSLPNFATKN